VRLLPPWLEASIIDPIDLVIAVTGIAVSAVGSSGHPLQPSFADALCRT
jgi:hypothetical protein